MSESRNRKQLKRWVKYCGWLLVFAVLYVLLDFSVDLRPPAIHSSYRFTLDPLGYDQAIILRQDNLSIVVVRRSPSTIAALRSMDDELQDPESKRSHQPDFADNLLRSRQAEYFVALALGTHFGCGLRVEADELTEICSQARYDLAGRALKGSGRFRNLDIPEYQFGSEYRTLTITP